MNLKNLIKNAAIYGLGNISTHLVGFILIPLYTKHMEVREYGVLGILEITAQILITVFGLSLHRGLMRWYWDEKYSDKKRSIFFSVLLMLIIIAILMNLIVQPFAANIARLFFENENMDILVQLMVFSASLQMLIQLPITLMRLQEKAVFYTIANISRLTIILILTIIFIVKFKRWNDFDTSPSPCQP